MELFIFIKKYPFLVLYTIFILGIYLIVRKGIDLEYEWLLILKDFEQSSEYRIYGVTSAFMPPLYPLFLILCKKAFSFTSNWKIVSCLFQASFFFCSVQYFYRSFIKSINGKSIVCVFAVVFFPPILFALCKISSFGFTVGIILLFFSQCYRIFVLDFKNVKEFTYLFLSVLCGLYLRYEFILLYAFVFLVLVFLRKINFYHFFFLIIFTWLLYLPWSIRNYEKIGTFTYSTSLNYNFAKGNNINFNIYSYYNFPYSPNNKEILYNNILYERLGNEKDIEEYLKGLNNSFITENPVFFVKLSLQKIAINFLQFFPDYPFLSKRYLAISYSILAVFIQCLFFFRIFKNIRNKINVDLSIMCLSVYFFFLFFYSIAPLPRYFLFFYPIFIMLMGPNIYQIFLKKIKGLN